MKNHWIGGWVRKTILEEHRQKREEQQVYRIITTDLEFYAWGTMHSIKKVNWHFGPTKTEGIISSRSADLKKKIGVHYSGKRKVSSDGRVWRRNSKWTGPHFKGEESLELEEAVHQTQTTCHLTVLMLKTWSGGFQDSLGVKLLFITTGRCYLVFFIRILSQVCGGALQRLNDLCCHNRRRTQLSAIKAGIERPVGNADTLTLLEHKNWGANTVTFLNYSL